MFEQALKPHSKAATAAADTHLAWGAAVAAPVVLTLVDFMAQRSRFVQN
jgi:hypothetical protein